MAGPICRGAAAVCGGTVRVLPSVRRVALLKVPLERIMPAESAAEVGRPPPITGILLGPASGSTMTGVPAPGLRERKR